MEIEEAIIPLHKPSVRLINPGHVIAILVLIVSAVAIHYWASVSAGFVQVHILDIGQGDAILITTPNGNQVLIDGGPDGAILSKLGEYLPSWDRDLDVIIVSHKHSDHITGLLAVLERYEVSHIVQGMESYGSAVASAWHEAVEREGASVTEGISGTLIDLGASTSLTVLYPIQSRQGIRTRDANNDSIVIMLRHQEVTMLFTGDAEAPAERQMLINDVDVDVDILKAGHHGSKTSSTPEFLSAVTPQAVIISLGEGNRYGHPHQVTLNRLASFGIPYYRTDQKGDVTVTSDGRSFSIRSQK